MEAADGIRSVVLLSGGMDSCVCAALAVRQGPAAFLHVDYGQRTERREREAFEAMAGHWPGTMTLVVRNEALARMGGSALTDTRMAVPEGGLSAGIPVTYVPFRNAHFLAAAVSWAEVLGAERVVIGAVEPDSSGYPDCRPRYYEIFNQLIAAGTREGRICIETPLIALTKEAIVRLGVELGAPFHLSWSCYQNSTEACGRCDSCRLRRRAFRQAGAEDPLRYAATAPKERI
jgi:7-cyano-7-deazaguanine synthase